MKFRRQDADDFGTSEWVLLAGNGQETPISIVNLSSEGFGFVVYWNGSEHETAETLAEAKQIALKIIA